MTTLIILRGYPGSGKTTVGKMLEKDALGKFIDHNAILNFITSITSNDDGIYAEIHALEKSMTKKLLTDGKNTIVARGFSSQKSIDSYVEIAKETNSRHIVIRLSVATEILEERVQSEERKLDFNPTTSADSLLTWIEQNPLENYDGEYSIDASKELAHVVSSITKVIEPVIAQL